ncbi:hypothetical protein [Solimonas flava]|uniref:hypothetical protein n=1 Tax=Solimonas flava TaxID=415849 RepID=UPI0004160516|nr:hypothetical protein [Solimonas flava]
MIWAWLVGKVGKLVAAAIAAVVLVLAVVGPFWLAYHMGWTARDAQALHEAKDARIAALAQLLAFGEQVNGIVGDYVLRRGQGEIVYRTLKQEVPRVVTVYRTAPGAAPQPLPQCLFTRGFLRVWDAALMPRPADGAGGADQAAEHTDPTDGDDLIAEGLDQQTVLVNHVENAELTHNDRLQCAAAIEFLKTLPGGAR